MPSGSLRVSRPSSCSRSGSRCARRRTDPRVLRAPASRHPHHLGRQPSHRRSHRARGRSRRRRRFDARGLPDDDAQLADVLDRHTVFGRVTPEQKKRMVTALQSHGHTVAMTGDGVTMPSPSKRPTSDRDELGIAGHQGRRQGLVLLDGQFSHLPDVVAEGRQVIANIERVSMLFLNKTVYATLLAIIFGAFVPGVPVPAASALHHRRPHHRHPRVLSSRSEPKRGALRPGVPPALAQLRDPLGHRRRPGLTWYNVRRARTGRARGAAAHRSHGHPRRRGHLGAGRPRAPAQSVQGGRRGGDVHPAHRRVQHSAGQTVLRARRSRAGARRRAHRDHDRHGRSDRGRAAAAPPPRAVTAAAEGSERRHQRIRTAGIRSPCRRRRHHDRGRRPGVRFRRPGDRVRHPGVPGALRPGCERLGVLPHRGRPSRCSASSSSRSPPASAGGAASRASCSRFSSGSRSRSA